MAVSADVRPAPPGGSGRLAAGGGAAATDPGGGPSRLSGLDGLRALAIVAVFVFHLNPAWLPGGFLGVDVFFVVSGFLITSLLVRERDRTGRLDLPAFWARRARRLLPALLTCVPASVLLGALVQTDLLVGIRRQVLGALTFSTNWLEVGAGSDYFNATTPQLFMNFWSLAVEEQFYLFWPVVVILLLRHLSRWHSRVAVTLGAGVTSTLLMGLLFDPDAGATRVYYGTDTHLMGLMFGAALAFAYAGPGRAWLAGPQSARLRRPVTVIALLALAAFLITMDESATWTFRGGLATACVATTALVAAAVSGVGTFPRVLELPPLRWIGERSYGIYLWHWPVILIVGQDLPSSPGSPGYLWTRAWCVLTTLAIADLSFRFIETPVRRDGWGACMRTMSRLRLGALRATPLLVGALVATLVIVGTVMFTAPDKTSTERMIEANEAAAVRPSATRSTTTRSTTTSPRSATTQSSTTSTGTPPGKAAFAMPKGKDIDAYGDSMMVGSWHALRYYFPGIRIDAKSNRQWSAALAAVVASGSDIRRAVILSFGTNAGVDEPDVRATLDRLGPDRMVVLVNLHLNMARTARDNATLAKVAADYPNAIVADWNAAATADPRQLQPDGIHPSLTGAHLYSSTIRAAFATLSERNTGKHVTLKPLPVP